jgi:hypothetical protein
MHEAPSPAAMTHGAGPIGLPTTDEVPGRRRCSNMTKLRRRELDR